MAIVSYSVLWCTDQPSPSTYQLTATRLAMPSQCMRSSAWAPHGFLCMRSNLSACAAHTETALLHAKLCPPQFPPYAEQFHRMFMWRPPFHMWKSLCHMRIRSSACGDTSSSAFPGFRNVEWSYRILRIFIIIYITQCIEMYLVLQHHSWTHPCMTQWICIIVHVAINCGYNMATRKVSGDEVSGCAYWLSTINHTTQIACSINWQKQERFCTFQCFKVIVIYSLVHDQTTNRQMTDLMTNDQSLWHILHNMNARY